MMRSQRIRHRSRHATPVISAAFAFAGVVVEATKRGLRPPQEAEPCGSTSWPDPTVSGVASEDSDGLLASASGQVFVLLGRELQEQRRRMLAADDRYQELRGRQQRLLRRRDETARRAYRGLVAARRVLKGLFGYEGACDFLGLCGPTKREPPDLHLQLGEAVWWARNFEAEIEPLHAGAGEEAEGCVAGLERLHARLDHALRSVTRGVRETEAAMLEQRAAMAEFDRTYRHVAGALEARLIGVGLPTLAAAVRPGVGRRGRPLKHRPVDRYPDLVEQVRLRGLITPDFEGSDHVRNGVAGAEEIERPLPKRPRGEKKTERLLPERSGSGEIIQHAHLECSEDEEKSQHLVHEPPSGEQEIAQPSHKSSDSETSSIISALTLSPRTSACGRDPRRLDIGERGYRVVRRPGGPVAGRSPGQRIRKTASSWWERLLRTA